MRLLQERGLGERLEVGLGRVGVCGGLQEERGPGERLVENRVCARVWEFYPRSGDWVCAGGASRREPTIVGRRVVLSRGCTCR